MNSEQKKALIAEKREKALERIKERQQAIKDSMKTPSSKRINDDTLGNIKSTVINEHIVKRPKMSLTSEQQELIEKNRQKALDKLKQRQNAAMGNLRDASNLINVNQNQSIISNKTLINSNGKSTYIRPSIHKADYIEYDFSTMQDTFGGFVSSKKLDKNGNPIEMTLTDWKNQQLEKKNMMIKDLDDDDNNDNELPPMDLHDAPKCYECGSYYLDKKMKEIFSCRVCKSCKEKHAEKYSLLTKTECKEDYFLTEPELADLALFKRIVKENPHSGTFSRMQLFLRYQIEEYAFKKWGSSENLDNEWLRREEMRKNRREKKFNNKLKEMRKKLRAEELTRNLRSQRDNKHVHDWSLPEKRNCVDDEKSVSDNSYIKRCIECGMEVEEILMQ